MAIYMTKIKITFRPYIETMTFPKVSIHFFTNKEDTIRDTPILLGLIRSRMPHSRGIFK